ncbi:MAG: phosphoenolpyruvate carboxykinase (GTP) [Evtepia sp.]|uniref:phosphoenolpyruvate carboxykinase (GTP) n=1 Tax=Evtepia sp. TaxID=2773933 RepID=UPI002A75C814|nr:phosphoenolpyruvate carboxykinase (GTP) [Evtepia sp.]MDY3015115.1 phosphoenolpyruvate carboxykinase (GTP) [Evtepia sp.]
MEFTNNKAVLEWIDQQINLTKPDKVIWIDGSEEQLEALRQEACQTGEIHELNQDKLPGCYLHRSDPRDVARVESRTFICCEKQEDAGPTNNWMAPADMRAKLNEICDSAMKGRTMYIIPYCMGVVGSPFAKYGLELTDSIYVVLNMAIMTRVTKDIFAALGDSDDFIKGLHAKADLDPEKRYIVQFPEENAIVSVNSGYGGNVLQGKKCFALRIASNLGRQEGWLAEHMLILGIQNPKGEVRYVTGAFPSACGKTNLAMIIPPEGYQKNGWKCWCVGDDIAWLRVGKDGRLWAVNPEKGFFGVAPGTNASSNPNALATTQKGTIFTNVALNLDDNTVWWEKLDKNPPHNALDWMGNPWSPETAQGPAAHPNSRFTAPAENCPCISPEFNNPDGVPISAVIFGGRRAKTAPLVYQSRDWKHGVFVGSIMASEKTAAAEGQVGETRRDPMAMLPFCGYHMGDYWQHWLDMEASVSNLPKIFNVNWFRTDENGEFIWPGFGENMRVLEWILKRCFDEVDARETEIGCLPKAEDINLDGVDVSRETLAGLLSVDRDLWREEVAGVRTFYAQFGDKLPHTLAEELDALENRLKD